MKGGSVAVAIAKVLIVCPAGSLAAQFAGGDLPSFALLGRFPAQPREAVSDGHRKGQA
jgi:hypothetical protein